MVGSSMLEVQHAIYDKLKGDATLIAMVTGIYDEVPQNTAFPYIQIGDFNEMPFNAFTKVGKSATFMVHVWSRAEGFKEGETIANRISFVLDYCSLTVTGYTFVACQFENAQTLRDPDGITRHISMRFRVLVRES